MTLLAAIGRLLMLMVTEIAVGVLAVMRRIVRIGRFHVRGCSRYLGRFMTADADLGIDRLRLIYICVAFFAPYTREQMDM